MRDCEPVIEVRGLTNRFGEQVVHENLDLTVCRGEIIGVAGLESIGVNVNLGGLYVADFTGLGGPIVTLNDVEQLVLRPLGGADFVHVSDTTGTDLQQVTVDLASTVNGAAPDAQTDTVELIGGLGDNTIAATMVGSTISVTGLDG